MKKRVKKKLLKTQSKVKNRSVSWPDSSRGGQPVRSNVVKNGPVFSGKDHPSSGERVDKNLPTRESISGDRAETSSVVHPWNLEPVVEDASISNSSGGNQIANPQKTFSSGAGKNYEAIEKEPKSPHVVELNLSLIHI